MKYAIFLMVLVSVKVQSQPIDLELVMKNMALDYKQALNAPNKAQFLTELDELLQGIETSKQYRFKQKAEQSLEGLNKVTNVINSAKNLALNNQLENAKAKLKEVDTHRKHYHKLHKKSVWQLIFG